MPYLPAARRHELDNGAVPQTAGELNYLFTAVALRYTEYKQEDYQMYNDVLGALEGAKQEFYRRKVVPYEANKRHENGDIYG